MDDSETVALRAEAADLRDRVEFMEWQALSLSTLSKAMQHARIVLFSMDRNGIVTMSDGRGLELLGQKPGERVGRNELEATRGTPAHDHLRRALDGETHLPVNIGQLRLQFFNARVAGQKGARFQRQLRAQVNKTSRVG